MRRSRSGIAVAAIVLAGMAVTPLALATFGESARTAGDEKPAKQVDPADVYYGDAKKWEKPAEVKPDDVYAKIDEYKQIVDEGLKPGDPKYDILMAKASKRFTGAVKKAAKDGGYDLVARVGSVKGVAGVPDITSDVIEKL